jgi:hypothetical protein
VTTSAVRVGQWLLLLFVVCAVPVPVTAAVTDRLSVHLVAAYSTLVPTDLPGLSNKVPEVLAVLRLTGQEPVAFMSRDGREPSSRVECFLGPHREAAHRPYPSARWDTAKRVVLQGGDSLYLGLLLLPRTEALRLRLFLESDVIGGCEDFVSDTLDVSSLPVSRLADGDEAIRAALRAFPGVTFLPRRLVLEVSSRHGNTWVVWVRSAGEPRVVFVDALSGKVVSGLEIPCDEY